MFRTIDELRVTDIVEMRQVIEDCRVALHAERDAANAAVRLQAHALIQMKHRHDELAEKHMALNRKLAKAYWRILVLKARLKKRRR